MKKTGNKKKEIRKEVKVNGIRVKSAKKGEEETKEQREQRLGSARAKFERKKNLTKEEKKIKRLYEELDKQYKRKQSARKLAQAVKNVPIEEAQEASEFLKEITNKKEKKGVNHNDE